jgi:BMFP domain-containing protein YqiC
MEGMTTAELLDAALEWKLNEDAAYTDTPDGDTPNDDTTSATTSDDGDTSTEQPNQPQTGDAETEVEGAPILSKSGAYTIPYEKLAEARNERNALRERVAQLEQQIAGLSTQQQQNLAAAQADAQDRASAGQGQTEADANLAAATQAMADGVDVSIFGDFSEEDLAKGIAELNRRATERVRAELQETIRQELAPLREKEAKSASQAHYDAILEKHADAFEIAESAEFAAWRDGLPAFAKAGVEHAMAKGTAQKVIEVFDAFRAASKPPQPTTQRSAPEAKLSVPNSLSDVPGAAPMDETQQTLAAAGNAAALLERMSAMSSDRIDDLLDNLI